MVKTKVQTELASRHPIKVQSSLLHKNSLALKEIYCKIKIDLERIQKIPNIFRMKI
jgi:hypothetical protein